MALNRDYIGRSFPPSEPYEVSRVKIAEFADAIGDPSPLCRDRDAARAAGYPDVIAPPTFAIVITMANSSYAVIDQDLGLDYSMVVHGEQRFEHVAPAARRGRGGRAVDDHRHPGRRAQRDADDPDRHQDDRR